MSLMFAEKAGIRLLDNFKFQKNGIEIKKDSSKYLDELGLINNSIIEVLEINEKNQFIKVIFKYKGKSYSLSANMDASFKNIALFFSNVIGVNIYSLDFYYNNVKLDTDSYNKNFRELGLNDHCTFNVYHNFSFYF